jgi:ATP-dependent exoDNAse (exonuclease V) beta subunit
VAPVAPSPINALAEYVAYRDAVERAALPRPARHRTPSGDHQDPVEPGTIPRDRNLARAAGTAAHQLLETWDFRDGDVLRKGIPAAAGSAAREFALDPDAVTGAVRDILEGFLASDLPRELAGAEILGREVPILLRDADGTTVHGYADLVYRREGRVHVADFKSDESTDAAHAGIYRSQLADYRDAVHRGLRLDAPPVAEVIFLRNGTRVELALEDRPR